MTRYCFLLQVRADLLAEYTERHAAVWPEMLVALRETGWERYALFARPDGLVVGYVEAEDLEAARRAMAETPVNTRWQQEMGRFFVGLDGRAPDDALVPLDLIFDLDEQLAAPTTTQEGRPA